MILFSGAVMTLASPKFLLNRRHYDTFGITKISGRQVNKNRSAQLLACVSRTSLSGWKWSKGEELKKVTEDVLGAGVALKIRPRRKFEFR